MKRFCSRWLTPTIFLTLFSSFLIPSEASAAQFTVFQKTYLRQSGSPISITDQFNVLNSSTTWLLKAINGSLSDDTIEKVSSSTLSLNGTEILKSNQFNQNVSVIDEPVTVNLSNTVVTEVRGKPGGQLTIQILGNDAIPPSVNWNTPAEGQFFKTSSIDAQLRLTDDVSGLNPASLKISLDSVSVLASFTPFTQPTLSSTLSATLPMSEGVHSLSAQVKDMSGQSANASVSFTVDRTPPVIDHIVPAEGSLLSTATPTLSGSFNDNLSGIKEDTIQISLDGINVTQQANTSVAGFSFVPVALNDGSHVLLISAGDKAGNSKQTEIHFTTDTSPPFISSLMPPDGTTVDNAQPTISATYGDLGSGIDIPSVCLKLDGSDITSLSIVTATAINFTPASELTSGQHFLELEVKDKVGHAATANSTFTAATDPSLKDQDQDGSTPQTGDCNDENPYIHPGALDLPGNGIDENCDGVDAVFVPKVVGLTQSSAEAAITAANLVVGAITSGHSDTVPSGDVMSQNPAANAAVPQGIAINFMLSLGPDLSNLPPDPSQVAPPVDPTIATSVYESTSFLYSGDNPVQSGVQPGILEPKRTAVLRGKVLNHNNTPLPGVVVSIRNHPEFGQTLSRADGMFDLAVNGGGLLTVDYQKEGFLPAQRQPNVPWQDYVVLPDVILTVLDEAVTTVDFTQPSMQVARGSIETDSDGTRQATLLIPPGTSASMIFPDGHTEALTSMSLRATEYTVGPNGPAAMPADLPPTSAYTYAVELSTDEALQAGAKSVEFNQPLYFYVDNFLHIPAGTQVPVGYYDNDRAAWIPSEDGHVMTLLDVVDGMAVLDLNGNGVPAGDDILDSLNITSEERMTIAQLYVPGQSFWRMPIRHLTTYDCNFSWFFEGQRKWPTVTDFKVENTVADPCFSHNSVVECENQTLGEMVPITGTPVTLVYKSDRMPGRNEKSTVGITLSGGTIPNGLQRIELEINIAGRQFTEHFPAQPNQFYTFSWDGLDAYGRKVTGPQTAMVRIGYVYNAYYGLPPSVLASFGLTSGELIPGFILARNERILWQAKKVQLEKPDVRSSFSVLGGWTINFHHRYDPQAQVLYLGSGQRRKAEGLVSSIVETVAGGGTSTASGIPATSESLVGVTDIISKEDGTLYISERGSVTHNRLLKVDPSGTITSFSNLNIIEPWSVAPGPEGTVFVANHSGTRIEQIDPVSEMVLFSTEVGDFEKVRDMAAGIDKSLFIADEDNRIWRMDPAGGIQKIQSYAGNGEVTYSGDGGPAFLAGMNPTGLAVGTDGSLYVTDTANHRVRRIDPTGLIYTIAGNGVQGYSGDGGLATEAKLNAPRGVAVDEEGNVFVSDAGNKRIRKIDAAGIITTVAGGELNPANGILATQATLSSALNTGGSLGMPLALGPDKSLYMVSGNLVRRVRLVFPSISSDDILIPSEGGKQVYHFDRNGRHLDTLDAFTGAVVFQFAYDGEGRLTQITDGFGNKTVIERDWAGTPLDIVSQDGLKTHLGLDANGYLSEITNPDGKSVYASYDPNGLMSSFTDAGGNASQITYDDRGRLLKDQNAAGGFWQLALTEETPNGFTVKKISALDRLTEYHIENLPTGDFHKTIIDPSGFVTDILRQGDATTTTIYPDGTKSVNKEGPDPRLGMLSSFMQQTGLVTPGGLSFNQTAARAVTLSNPQNIFSLDKQTDTVNINGRTFSRLFDHSLMKWTDTSAQGRTATTTINEQGRPINSQIANLLPVIMTYDSRGRLSSVSQGTGGEERKNIFAYNSEGFLSSITDSINRSVQYEYDLAGRITKEILPGGREISYAYDANGNVTSIAPPGRPQHEFVYTPINLVEEYVPPVVSGTGKTTYFYNLDKQLTRITRPDGQMINYDYDSGGRLAHILTPRGQTTYSYDSGTGNLATITTPDGGTLTYAYDGFLPLSTSWGGLVHGSVGQTYDNNFWVTSRLVNGGSAVNFSYDNDGLLTQAGALQIQRDAATGFLKGTTLSNISTALTYNNFGELASDNAKYSSTIYLEHQYAYDQLGRIINKTETQQSQTEQYAYTYDLASRLTDVTKNGTAQAHYEYDANGNRLSRTASGITETGIYDDHDRLLSYGNFTYTYTANGELKTKTNTSTGQTTQYEYDLIGNLMKVTLPDGKVIDYIIDGNNRRIGKKINGSLVLGFLYQDQLNPVAELDGSNNVVSQFVYGTRANVPDYMIKGGKTYRIISDHLGSVRMVVDTSNGTIVQKMDYDEFGRVLSDTSPGFQPFGFAGGLYEPDTGLTRFGFRDYDAYIGRWTSKDMILFVGGDANLFGYVYNDPINFIDAFGLCDQIPWWENNWVRRWVPETPIYQEGEWILLEPPPDPFLVITGRPQAHSWIFKVYYKQQGYWEYFGGFARDYSITRIRKVEVIDAKTIPFPLYRTTPELPERPVGFPDAQYRY